MIPGTTRVSFYGPQDFYLQKSYHLVKNCLTLMAPGASSFEVEHPRNEAGNCQEVNG